MAKIWLVTAKSCENMEDDPWDYDCYWGGVVRADNENEARKMMDKNGADENWQIRPWLDKNYSSCKEITIDGEKEIILRDYRAG